MGALNEEILLLLVPVLILIIALAATALLDLRKRERVAGNNKLVWGAIIILIQVFGPLAYFLFGRKD